MATPAETRDQLIRDLRKTRDRLTSAAWLSMLSEASEKQKDRAGRNLMKVHHALQKLEREALTSFRDQLVANEAEIAKSTKSLQAALDRLESVAKVLSALTALLKLVGRVVALV
jgi:hypothetical protein